jgi:hypothetical protein
MTNESHTGTGEPLVTITNNCDGCSNGEYLKIIEGVGNYYLFSMIMLTFII